MDRPLTDTELRAAASQRPNYATYPEYRRLIRCPQPICTTTCPANPDRAEG